LYLRVVGINWEFDGHKRSFTWQYVVNNFSNIILSGMSIEASNQRKSPVTLTVTAGHFFSLKKIMRENLSSISNTKYSVCIYWSACLRLQIFTNKHRYISSNPNNISHYFPLIGDEIVDGEGLKYSGYIFSFFF
jgi:hypothetical protein